MGLGTSGQNMHKLVPLICNCISKRSQVATFLWWYRSLFDRAYIFRWSEFCVLPLSFVFMIYIISFNEISSNLPLLDALDYFFSCVSIKQGIK
jgi:hypothetical protein